MSSRRRNNPFKGNKKESKIFQESDEEMNFTHTSTTQGIFHDNISIIVDGITFQKKKYAE
jgi:hypothetical protein